MAVKITSKDGNVVITADDGSSVSGITVDGDEIIPKKRCTKCRLRDRCQCSECRTLLFVASLVITFAMTVVIYYVMWAYGVWSSSLS